MITHELLQSSKVYFILLSTAMKPEVHYEGIHYTDITTYSEHGSYLKIRTIWQFQVSTEQRKRVF